MQHQRIPASWPIRRKLLLLFLCIFLPALGIVAALGWNERQDRIDRAKEQALLVAKSLAAQQDKIVTGTRQLLSTLAQLPELQQLDAQACNELFRRLQEQNPSYSNISMATPDGMLFASSMPFEPGTLNLADRRHIKEAIRTLDFSAGEYILGRLSKSQSINYAYPVLDQDRKLVAIVMAAFKPDEYTHYLSEINLPADSVISIVDHKGVRVFRWPEHENAGAGKPVPRDTFELAGGTSELGTYERISDDGVTRYYVFKRLTLKKDTPPYLFVFVGLSKANIMKEANARLAMHLTILGIGALIAAALAWLFVDSTVIKPIRSLASAAEQFGEGRLSVRTGLPHTDDELGQLAQSFDNMAALLEVREEERKKAEEDWERTFDAVPDLITILDNNHRIVRANKPMAAKLGLTTEECVGLTCYEAVHGASGPPLFCPHRQMLDDRAAYTTEVHEDRLGGDFAVSVSPIFDSSGNIIECVHVARDITERKQAVEMLRESEEKFRALSQSTPTAIMLYQNDRWIYANPAAETITGYTLQELLTMNFRDFIHPDYIQVVQERRQETQKGEGAVRRYEIKIIAKDGREKWVDITSSTTMIGGSPAGIISVIDITLNKTAAEALKQSEEQVRLLLNSTGEAIYGINLEGNCTFANPSCLRMLGYAHVEQLLGRNMHQLVHYSYPDGRPMNVEDCRIFQAFREGKQVHVDDEVLWKADGTGFPVEYWSYPQMVNGNVSGAVVAFIDITERKEAEAALRESRQKFQGLVEMLYDWVWEVDTHGQYTYVSPQIKNILGYEPHEILGKTPYDLMPPEEAKRVSEKYAALIKERKPIVALENVNSHKDGRLVVLETNGLPFHDSDGNFKGYRGTDRDITARRQAETNLQKVNEKLAANLSELVVRNREIAFLAELKTLFQICRTLEESFSMIKRVLSRFFSPFAGALYIRNSSQGLMEAVLSWGDPELEGHMLDADDCLGMRIGKPHITDDPDFLIECNHKKESLGTFHLCVPFTTQSDIAGVLYLQHTEKIENNKLQIAKAIVDSISLSLANLKLHESLHEQSIRDPLTGLFNRRFMEETLSREVARTIRSKRPLGVMMIDIDHFKKYNDTNGHEAGDMVLKEVGKMLKSEVRAGDIACRYGGEEFVIIMAETPLELLVQRAETLRKRAGELVIEYAGKPLEPITISIGVSVMPDHASEGQELLRQADAALYQAKQEGRNRVKAAG